MEQLNCFMCIVHFQGNERENVLLAVTVYKGMALCPNHVNTERGLPAAFTRYPKEEPWTPE